MGKSVLFIDSEISVEEKEILDIGAVREDGSVFHSASTADFARFAAGADFLCGHNAIHHDMNYLRPFLPASVGEIPVIDTLYLSPLLFPDQLSHALSKDEKQREEDANNPVSDSRKARELFLREVSAFRNLPGGLRRIFCSLLYDVEEFHSFFAYLGYVPFRAGTKEAICQFFAGKLCTNAALEEMIQSSPAELAYALALIHAKEPLPMIPPWAAERYPALEHVMARLRNTPCEKGCDYCGGQLDIHKGLKRLFGFDQFRVYAGEPLQERAAQAAVEGKSLLAIFPTGGGKSITFQLPALMAGEACRGLTVVISPLQSLMKDQVDHLNEAGIVEAVTVNGLLSPIERADAFQRVADGRASLLYLSPEQLRSKTVERMLLARRVVRFVIDEAHCFSAWGQDFRVDYLYIGDFIRRLQEKKDGQIIPVSCFTATAKQKVVSDISDYFRQKLGLNLELFASTAVRENLHYVVLHQETDDEKYQTLRSLVEQKNCPTIVYVARTKRTKELAERLTRDGFPARPFNGKMERQEKIENQEAFLRDEIRIIVATSAFGMGVDKKNVGLVVHYDISDSLENYVQEAGRAGRDESLQADCYVLYNDQDLDRHFILLNQSKLNMSEIQQVWKAIKDMSRQRMRICCSPLEIARQAGWDNMVFDVETRVKTAIAALENAGYIKRGQNMPRVYATGILAANMQEASARLQASPLFTQEQRLNASRILQSLLSSRSLSKAKYGEAESRVDYLADMLGLTKEEVVTSINLMRQAGLLEDSKDMSAYIFRGDTQNRTAQILDRFAKLEEYLLGQIGETGGDLYLKEVNGGALEAGIASSSVKNIRTILYYLTIKNYISKEENGNSPVVRVKPLLEQEKLLRRFRLRIDICRFAVERFYEEAVRQAEAQDGRQEAGPAREEQGDGEDKAQGGKMELLPVSFSLVGLYRDYVDTPNLLTDTSEASLTDVEDALLYLSKIGAVRLEGGFLVLYNGMEINRIVRDNRIKYKVDDYRMLNEFYAQKIRQIHIVGEYANLMVRDYDAALQFVQDYFQMDFQKFIAKYFKGERAKEISRNITPEKYRQLFGELSDTQSRIIQDADSRCIVVAAGPGSGKTRLLVHKLAALILLEDVKYERLLMLTFSRAAATEFKMRLMGLIGNAANFVEIKTFHSYCFDLLGKVGSLEDAQSVVKNAAEMIRRGEVEPGRITKSVLVIDEAQDMDENEFSLVRALMEQNEDMRVIAVGDDDQNIYEFRGSDSRYLKSLIEDHGAVKYEMEENFRSCAGIVHLANAWVGKLGGRMKTSPVRAVRPEYGTVCLVRHAGGYLEEPLADQICRTHSGGSACVLTNTNEEAMRVEGLLLKKGVRAKLIQSMDRFPLCQLAEVRFLMELLDNGRTSAVIGEELWNEAERRLEEVYGASACLENCKNMMRKFEMVNPARYWNDLVEFVKESRYEDFYSDEKGVVYVSTIHKSKGREFDQVYMLLSASCGGGSPAETPEEIRKLYVGLTRAKNDLYVHYSGSLFSGYRDEGAVMEEDAAVYPEPYEVCMQLSYRDVVLDYFKGYVKTLIPVPKAGRRSADALRAFRPRLFSGQELWVDRSGQNGVYIKARIQDRDISVAKLSKASAEKLAAWVRKGYEPVSARVRFIAAWKPAEEGAEELMIVLPDIVLRKSGGGR